MSNCTLINYKISSDVVAFTTTRKGGCSNGNYSSFNFCPYSGDTPENIKKNKSVLCQELGIEDKNLFTPIQIHGNQFLLLDQLFLEKDPAEQESLLNGVDAIITNKAGICIGIFTADCVPILLYNEQSHVAAAVHAGWKGTLTQILSEVLEYMSSKLNCHPHHTKAIIGPSISLESFEVGKDVFQLFANSHLPIKEISAFVPNINGDAHHNGISGKWHIDLWNANVLQLLENDVPLENIQVANLCTYKNSDLLFSARKLGKESGRLFSGIMIKS